MFETDDMVDFAAEICIFDSNAAIFASAVGASFDFFAQIIADITAYLFSAYLRAKILAILIKCSSCI